MRLAFVFSVAVSIAPVAVLADEACRIPAYSSDSFGFDIAVHEGPSLTSPVKGVLAKGQPGTDDEGFGAEFVVVEMVGGWARIAQVTGPDGIGPGGPEGWMDGGYIQFVAQTGRGYAAPDAGSDPVYTGTEWPYAQALLDCSGDWAQIRFDVLDLTGRETVSLGQTTAWVRGACSNQRTTCDGLSGDAP
ncbi:MAG: hypothetical protein WAT09_02970 [Paracoccaceae bacterium]